MSFINKVALITGASSGIGLGTARELASRSCKLAITGRNQSNLNKCKELCLQASNGELKDDHVLVVLGDVSKTSDCKAVVDQVIKHFGQLDVLVNSAGIITKGTTENTSLEDFDQMMNVNTRAVFYLSQLAIPHLKKTKGSIVNVSSVCGLRAFPGICSYAVSKAAVDQLTRCTALELAADGVRVNAVNPGVIVTELHRTSGFSEEEYKKFLEHSKSTHALGRPGTVEEVAKSIAFLASSDASFITGETLSVDGGRSIMCPR